MHIRSRSWPEMRPASSQDARLFSYCVVSICFLVYLHRRSRVPQSDLPPRTPPSTDSRGSVPQSDLPPRTPPSCAESSISSSACMSASSLSSKRCSHRFSCGPFSRCRKESNSRVLWGTRAEIWRYLMVHVRTALMSKRSMTVKHVNREVEWRVSFLESE